MLKQFMSLVNKIYHIYQQLFKLFLETVQKTCYTFCTVFLCPFETTISSEGRPLNKILWRCKIMKMRHKRSIKRIVAGVLALLFAYAVTFGGWVVFPFAIGFASVQILLWKLKENATSIFLERPLAFDYSVIIIIILTAICILMSNAITASLTFIFGIGGVILSYLLSKVEIKNKKKKNR